MVEFTLKFTQWAQGLSSMNEDFNVQLSLRVFHSLHNTTVKMSEGVVLFTFCTFFIDVKVANLSEVKLYIIMILLWYISTVIYFSDSYKGLMRETSPSWSGPTFVPAW